MNDQYEVHIFDYLQKDKIDQIYGQLVERSEKTSVKQRTKDKGSQIEGQAGFGNLLASLGLGVSAKASSSNKQSETFETSYELSSEQKLRAVWEILSSQGNVDDLNKCIKSRTNPSPSAVLVKFKAKRARFSYVEDPDIETANRQVKVSCLLEDYSAEFYCSLSWFQVSSIAFDIQNNVVRDIKGIAAVKQIRHKNKNIILNPIAF